MIINNKSMRGLLYICVFIHATVLFGQNDNAKLFEPALIKADMDTLISNMKAYHPTFLDYYQDNKVQSKIDSIKKTMVHPMTSLDFFRIMQPIISIDGHTTLTYTGEVYPKIDNPFCPFKVIIFNNSLYVKEHVLDNKRIAKGSVIESINGMPTQTIIKNLIKYVPGEKEAYKIKTLERDFHIFFRLVYGSFSDYEITVNNTEFKLKGAKWDDFQEPSKPKFELRFYDDDIAYIYKRGFKAPKDFIHFMDSAFKIIKDRQIRYLIIDNLKGGGMTDLADTLLTYFSKNPYCMFEKKKTKISALTEGYIESIKAEGVFKDGYFIQDFPLHKPKSNNFSGTTFILTGTTSYSTATCFPAAAKCYQNAIIIGEESGQPLLSNGGLDRFKLPHTKLTCYTSLSEIYMPCNHNDTEKGVIPDYLVTPSLNELLNDEDYILEYTLKMIRDDKEQ